MTRCDYDIVVIGAGPAGALAAYRCARAGASVLLVDKQRFPREKVCGCCVSAAAVGVLERAGLSGLIERHGGPALRWVRVHAGRSRATLPIPDGFAIGRGVLDQALVDEAVRAGAAFRDCVVATVGRPTGETREVSLPGEVLRAGVVILATGLGTRLAEDTNETYSPSRGTSRIGFSAVLDNAHGCGEPGVIQMVCGRGGYVGVVQLADGRLNIAAAMAPVYIKGCGGPGAAVQDTLEQCGLKPMYLPEKTSWQGTPRLTRRRRRVAAERLLIIGDAAGYVEPFTGEGIAWALACGAAAAGLAVQPWSTYSIDTWSHTVAALRARQGVCRWAAALLRHPTLTRCAVKALSAWPWLARPMVQRINRPLRLDSLGVCP